MKKFTALTAFLFGLLVTVNAQQPVLKGTITDTAAKQNLEHALITLLRAKDSTLYRFARADKDGRFEIRNLKPGAYKAVISYLGYADYVEDVRVADQPVIEMGSVSLVTKAHLLEDIVLRTQIASIRLKGDTLEYKADSFKVRPGASIEEMLRIAPGFQIDKDGKITVNGEKIEKVLVEGEEFFADDPTIVTRNIDAAAVDKFQVFDKKSDQATFTGIDDGTKTKTLNFKLKEDRKRGVFGKMELAGGPQDKWNNSLMANAFKGKQRISFFGIMSSTGKTGLGWDESGKYGGDNATQTFTMDDGSTVMGRAYDSFDDVYGSGIPKSWSAGLNYGNKFSEDRKNLNGSYKYGKILTEGTGTTSTQNILSNAVLKSFQSSATVTDRYRNTLSGSYDWMFDSSFSAKLTVNAYKGNSKKHSIFNSSASNQSGLVNESDRKSSSETDDQSFNSTFILRKKFRKPGQTLSFSINQNYLESNTDGFLYSLNRYYNKSGVNNLTDTTDQEKINGSLNRTITGRLAYTQMLTKSITMELSYGMGQIATESKLLSYDRDFSGKYASLNKSFSNSYAYDVTTNTGGMMFRYAGKKLSASAGGDITKFNIDQHDMIKDSLLSYNYVNLFPRANIGYKFNSNRRVQLNYNGRTNQPTISQLQPVADNTNPNVLQVGNPNLKQEFRHSVDLYYYDYKVLKDRGLNIGFNFSTTANAIRNNTTLDTATGKTTYQYVNIDGNYSYGGRIGFSRKLPKLWGMNFNMGVNANRTVSSSYVNGQLGRTHSGYNSFSFGLSKYKENAFDFYIDNSLNYNTSYSTIRPGLTNNYWTYNLYASLNVQLPKNFELSQNISGIFRQSTEAFSGSNNVFNWNMYLGKKVFKDKKSEIRFSAFDILNQNKGVSRSSSTTTVTETTFQTLSQYFLVSFIWNFIKNPSTSATNAPAVITK